VQIERSTNISAMASGFASLPNFRRMVKWTRNLGNRCECRTPEQREERMKQLPMHRHGTSEEVAQLVAFLLSDESSYITSAEIAMDGTLIGLGPRWGNSTVCAFHRESGLSVAALSPIPPTG
jgi:NAD(P)-dependent dehydrogenase (short-subunit alcohol dehydrogenase family)